MGVGRGVGVGVGLGVGGEVGVDVGTGVGAGIEVGDGGWVGDGKAVAAGVGLGIIVGVGAAVAGGSGVGLEAMVGSGWVQATAAIVTVHTNIAAAHIALRDNVLLHIRVNFKPTDKIELQYSLIRWPVGQSQGRKWS